MTPRTMLTSASFLFEESFLLFNIQWTFPFFPAFWNHHFLLPFDSNQSLEEYDFVLLAVNWSCNYLKLPAFLTESDGYHFAHSFSILLSLKSRFKLAYSFGFPTYFVCDTCFHAFDAFGFSGCFISKGFKRIRSFLSAVSVMLHLPGF